MPLHVITPRMSTSITVTDLKTGIGSQGGEDICIGQENIKLALCALWEEEGDEYLPHVQT